MEIILFLFLLLFHYPFITNFNLFFFLLILFSINPHLIKQNVFISTKKKNQNGRLCCSYSYPCLNELTNHDYSRSSSIMTDKTAAISRSTGDIASNDVDDDDDDDGRKQHGNGEYMQSSIDDDSHNSELLKPFMNSLIGHEQESMEKFSKISSDKNTNEFDDRDNSIDNHDIDNDDFSLSSSNTNIIHMNQPLTIKQKSTNSIDKIYDKNNDAIDNDWSHEMASN